MRSSIDLKRGSDDSLTIWEDLECKWLLDACPRTTQNEKPASVRDFEMENLH